MKLEPDKEIKLPTSALAVCVAPDGATAYAACMDGGVYAVDVAAGTSTLLGKHASYASGVVLAGKHLVSSGYDGALIWWDAVTRKQKRKVQAHGFWSWQLAASPDGRVIASVTGQYLAGGMRYEPATEREPSLKLYNAATGRLLRALPHVPPALSVAFTPDGRHVAAGNMMGEVRVYEVATGKLAATVSTPDFTSWGIIKSHHYIGGIFGLAFAGERHDLLACGMGAMRDPMAGNGKQTWQRWDWRASPPRKLDQIHDGDQGNGLMETLAAHPRGGEFVMAGRLAQGKWNVALFDGQGALAQSLDTKSRVTRAVWSRDGGRLFLAGALSQDKKKEPGKPLPDHGRLHVYRYA
jgi:WD40 repeat protein